MFLLITFKNGTLYDEIQQRRVTNQQFNFDELMSSSIEILNGIQYLHDRGLIHRKIKPTYKNLLIKSILLLNILYL